MSYRRGISVHQAILGILGLVSVFGFAVIASHGFPKPGSVNDYPEVAELLKHPLKDFDTYRQYFQNLARVKGAVYAYDVLRDIPPLQGINTHFLGHYIGYILYDQKGIKGITDCTSDFQNACSHAIVISAFIERGDSALQDIARACEQAPGTSWAYEVCFHGLGHGILAYLKYDFEKAIPTCVAAADTALSFGANSSSGDSEERAGAARDECIGGVVMEMILGIHDPEAWLSAKPRYLPSDDPLMPCDATFIPADARPACYVYIAERFFETGDDGNVVAVPSSKAIENVFAACDRIPEEEKAERAACFGGIGEEYFFLVRGGDVRNVESMRDADFTKIHEACALAPRYEAREDCIMAADANLFWGGENDPHAAISFCRMTPDPALRDICYSKLAKNAIYFLGKTPERAPVCEGLPQPQQNFCFAGGI